jgi:hypothetical protein
MKIDMAKLRWVLLGLYTVIVLGLFGIAFTEVLDLPFWLWPFGEMCGGEPFWTIGVLLATVISQAVFVFCSGTINLCQPIRKRRAFLPVVLTAFLLTVLVVAVFLSLVELIEMDDDAPSVWGFWILIGVNWIGWSIAFLVTYTQHDRYTVARKLLLALFRGSLLELLVAIPSHIIVSRRPGCFVGMLTGLGVSGGISVMLWAFGPGIILLFLRDRYRRESKRRIQQKDREGSSGSALPDELSS